MKISVNILRSFLSAAILAVSAVGPLGVSANPFVEYSEIEKENRASAPANLSQPPGMRLVPIEEEKAKDIKVLGLIGDKVAVTIDGKVSTVWDGSEIGPCLIAYPEVLCTDREKERLKKRVTLGKLKDENSSLRKKTVTLEKEFVDLSKQISYYKKAVELATLLDDGEDLYIPELEVTARAIIFDDKTMVLRTDIDRGKVAAALQEKASEVYGFAGYTYAVVPGRLP